MIECVICEKSFGNDESYNEHCRRVHPAYNVIKSENDNMDGIISLFMSLTPENKQMTLDYMQMLKSMDDTNKALAGMKGQFENFQKWLKGDEAVNETFKSGMTKEEAIEESYTSLKSLVMV